MNEFDCSVSLDGDCFVGDSCDNEDYNSYMDDDDSRLLSEYEEMEFHECFLIKKEFDDELLFKI